MHKLYKEKLVSIPDAVSKVKSNQIIATGVITTEPPGLLAELGKQKDRLKGVKVYLGFLMRPYELISNENMKGHIECISTFYGPSEREGHRKGLVSFLPGNLGENTSNILHANKGRIDIFWGIATPPNADGYVNISIGNVGDKQLLEAADMVVLEINKNLPWTHGDTLVHLSDVNYVVENNFPLLEVPQMPKEDWQDEIGKYIADLIEDGSTMQFGIGGIPDAISEHLSDKKDLGVHSEMLTSGIVDLYKSGVITGKKKNIWKDKIICTFVLGNKALYEFVDNNPVVEVHRGKTVNDPYVISQHDKMVSINTALAVDVRGQVCSQSIGHMHYSGTGGQLEFHLGARLSKGGRGIIALKSTARGGKVSTIVPLLDHGSEVTIACHQVDTIVTEYGVAEMIGRSIKERTEALIKIAHPNFRDQIREESIKLGLV